MNFFQAQDQARRKTWQLGFMFVVAVLTLIVLTNLLVAFAFGWTGQQSGLTFAQSIASIPPDAWLWITLGVTGMVALACAYKYLSIQGGGRAIAESLGGSVIHPGSGDAKQQRLLNVVEEMAIAAGVPVPPVYLIPEPGINAFAAGFGMDDAVIGINQGTLDILDRDELQGVVAHEFSHILNGDTNINLRLIAILHGILFLGMIGFGLMRAGGFSRKNGLPLIMVGIGLLIIGYGGTFFGNLIKAAVSRQREFLADASAVQFTRNPAGIADALKKIGGYSNASYLQNQAADEVSHMFFGAAAKKFSGSFMATHPPLQKRILAIEPNWDGQFPAAIPTTPTASTTPATPRKSTAGSAGVAGFAGATGTGLHNSIAGQRLVEQLADEVGAPTHVNLAAAQALIASNGAELNHAAHDPYEARALVYAMLISRQQQERGSQLQFVHEQAEAGVPEHVERLLIPVRNSDQTHLLTLLEMSMPALKTLSHNQYKRFSNNAARLITADEEIDLFEWVLHRLLVKELYPHFEGPQRQHGHIRNIHTVADEAAELLSIIASHSHHEREQQLAAYRAGAAELGITQAFAEQRQFDYARLNNNLGKLRKLRPLVKPALLKACASAALADGELNDDEYALLHGIAATLDCPLPAHLPGTPSIS